MRTQHGRTLPRSRPRIAAAAAALVAAGALTLTAACGDDELVDDTSGAEAEAVVLPPFRIGSAAPGPFVRVARGGCTEGPDACETRGDCEALPVDCGGPEDRLLVHARWASSDDVDLAFVEPNGDILSELRLATPLGGGFEGAAGRTCVPGTPEGHESARYRGPTMESGTYRVLLTHFGTCMSGLGSVDVDVTFAAAGRHLATYRASLAPHDRLEALSVSLGP